MNLDGIIKALKQKTTWAGISIIVAASLPLFGVSAEAVAGIVTAIGGLALIFLRAGIEKNKPEKPI